MNPRVAYGWLLEHGKETAYIESAERLLGWDQRTCMPPKGQAHRAAQFGALARLLHGRDTDPRTGDALAVVEEADFVKDPLSVEAVNIREWRRDFDRAVKIPERLAVELALARSEGEGAWRRTRPANDWPGFRPFLNRIISLKREEAEAVGYVADPYDALLDGYEPGETTRNLEALFSRLREAIVSLLGSIGASGKKPDTSVLHRKFPIPAQEAFVREVVAGLGYDFEGGRLDPTAHPFATGIGPGDSRITTRYLGDFFSPAFFGTVHEAGHALYQQGLPEEHWGTPFGRSVSLGIHESQSRLWENFVSRSLGFWRHFFPLAQRRFEALKNVPLEAFHFAINAVGPGLIRIEADEVTYNLHVLLRFELELALMRREIDTDDLPGAWNEKMKSYTGLTPPDHASGVMQDIHWSGGSMGYFPTYTLGNLYAAQLFARAEKELGDLDAHFSEGRFAPLLGWLREKVHSQGRRRRAGALIEAATDEKPDPGRLIDYRKRLGNPIYSAHRHSGMISATS